MGLFDKIFKSEREISKVEIQQVPWNQLTNIDTVEKMAEESYNQPVAVLKHSTRCGISKMVLRNFESSYSINEGKVKLYFLDLLNYRDISNKIASRFNVPHESPQLIVLKDGKVIHSSSHSEIDAEKLKSTLA